MNFKMIYLSPRRTAFNGDRAMQIELSGKDDKPTVTIYEKHTTNPEVFWKDKEWKEYRFYGGHKPTVAPEFWTDENWSLVDRTVKAMMNFHKTYNQGE